jgi:hypothetical protein
VTDDRDVRAGRAHGRVLGDRLQGLSVPRVAAGGSAEADQELDQQRHRI